MKKELTNQVVIITGASAGIGAALATESAKRGMNVVLAARRENKLNEVAKHLTQYNCKTLIVPTDVAHTDDVTNLIDQTMQTFGRIDVMVANAGFGSLSPIETLDEADHKKMFEVNYFGTVRCVQKVIPVMRKQNGGHIIITSSIVGRIGLPLYAHYSATKSAQYTLAMGLRAELHDDNIKVTTVHPIGTRTEFFNVAAEQSGRDTSDGNTPDMFMQSPDHVAKRIADIYGKNVSEVWPARWSKYGSWLGLLLSPLTNRALRKHYKKDVEKYGLK